MFVRYFVEVPLAADQVERALRHPQPGWLAAMAGAAQQRDDDLLTEVGVGPLGPRLGRRVAIRLGDPVRYPSMVSLPLTWEPLGLQGLLPRLDASIELGDPSATTGPSWPSAPTTGRRWGWSGGPSTRCCCAGWPRRPSRTSWTGSARRSS